MLTVEEWIEMRYLYMKGLSISEIAKKTGRDRKTVRKYVLKKDPPESMKRKPRPSKLDPYKPYILEK
jgi:transposase